MLFVVISYFEAGTLNVRSRVIHSLAMPAIFCPFNRFVPTGWNIELLPEFLSPSAASDCLGPEPGVSPLLPRDTGRPDLGRPAT